MHIRSPNRKLYYRLILEKAFHVELDDFFLYLELQEEGARLCFLSPVLAMQFKASLKDKILDMLPLEMDQTCVWDTQESELVFSQVFDFTKMGHSLFVKKLESFQKKIFECLILIEKFHVEHQLLR